jgi:hypothetical protein
MGGVNGVHGNNAGQAAISIAISLSNGLNNAGGAQAFAGPNGAFAQAGGPGGLNFGNISGGCGCGRHNFNALGNNFAPQNPYQAGMQDGFRQAKMQGLMQKMFALMSEMQSLGGGGPMGGGPVPFGAGGSYAFAGGNSFGNNLRFV